MSDHSLSSVCKDAFIVLHGVIEMRYGDGDVWRPEEGQTEHPIVPRLRAASMTSMLSDPPPIENEDMAANPLFPQLRDERRANELLRAFAHAVEDLCLFAGLPKAQLSGPEVLLWLKNKLSATGS